LDLPRIASGRNWEVLDCDRELFERELQSFVPARIFDAHAHLHAKAHFREAAPEWIAGGPEVVDLEAYRRYNGALIPGRGGSGLFFAFPHLNLDEKLANAFVAAEARKDPASRAQMLVLPGMDPEWIRTTVRAQGFVGLKCYHVYAREQPTWNAAIASFLPEEQVRIAHEERLSITLHIMRPRALADGANQETIRRYAERYPGMRLILAHAARGFNPHHTIQGIESLRGLRNVWCDTSAVTEAGAFEAIIGTLGVEHLLYGSDFAVSHLRGRCVAVGDSFLWLSAQNTDYRAWYGDLQPVLVGLESLRVLKLACRHLRLSDSQVERIFFHNAAELYGLDARA
jgi:predicted TIM-barrel fold metal-dependent hydrolase